MQTFYQYTTGVVLLSVAVSVLIYRDTYRITLHVLRYISYRMTVISSRVMVALKHSPEFLALEALLLSRVPLSNHFEQYKEHGVS